MAGLVLLVVLQGCAGRSGLPEGATRAASPSRPAVEPRAGQHGLPLDIVSTAKSQIGAPYVSAGCSPSVGFDCSGFVWWVYGANGVVLPRTTRDLLAAGKTVRGQELDASDLVFFQTGKSESSLHVGIYTGDGRFIHSPSSGGRVREDTISSNYWRSHYIGARRFLELSGELGEETRGR